MKLDWSVVRLAEVLHQRKEFITIDDVTAYRRPRVKLHAQGIVLRDEVPGALIKTKRQQICHAGQLLVAEIDAKVGGFGIVPNALDGCIVSSHYFLFDVNDAKLARGFLDYFVRTPAFREQVAAQGSTNYAAIRPTDVLGYEIPLPPLAEQRRVVARIKELAAQIKDARTLHEQTVRETEILSCAAIEARYRALRNDLGCQPLATVFESITDGDHNTPAFGETGVRFIFVGNVSTGHLHFDKSRRVGEEYFKQLSRHRVPRRGDILYSAVGATLGIPAVVDVDEPFCFQRHVAILKPNRDRLDSQFAWYMLRSRTVFEKAWASKTGSAQPTVPLRAIRELPIPVPRLPEQRRIAAELDALQREVDAVTRLQAESAAELDSLLPAILDRAFKGSVG